jgi:hypothetical protein
LDETVCHESPPFSLTHSEPVVDPNASTSPLSSMRPRVAIDQVVRVLLR